MRAGIESWSGRRWGKGRDGGRRWKRGKNREVGGEGKEEGEKGVKGRQ